MYVEHTLLFSCDRAWPHTIPRMCSLTIECVLLLQIVSFYTTCLLLNMSTQKKQKKLEFSCYYWCSLEVICYEMSSLITECVLLLLECVLLLLECVLLLSNEFADYRMCSHTHKT